MANKPILLDKPVTLSQLSSGEGFTFQASFDDIQGDSSDSDEDICPQLSGKVENINLEDEDLYEFNAGLFDDIVPLLTPVDKDGNVMKRIFRQGSGELIPENSKVTYHYKAYMETEALPFDSTYARKKPEISKIHEILYGLGIALQSMKVNEKSQFLIKPEWAYGAQGIQPSIPPNSSILFEVEVINFILIADSDDCDDELKDSHDYAKNYERALRLCDEAKHLITIEKKDKPAIRNYNQAVYLLCNIGVKDEEQEKEYVTLLLKLYKNLAIAHNRIGNWKKACINCIEVYKLCKTFYRDVDCKVYYAHAKALTELKHYDRAEEQLRKAAKIASYDRPNADIMNLYRKITAAKAEDQKAETTLAKAMLK